MINEPNPLFLSTSTTLNPWTTMANCYKLQFDLGDSFNIKSKERYAKSYALIWDTKWWFN